MFLDQKAHHHWHAGVQLVLHKLVPQIRIIRNTHIKANKSLRKVSEELMKKLIDFIFNKRKSHLQFEII